MVFSDADLKRLKYARWPAPLEEDVSATPMIKFDRATLMALLARLEASERKNRAADAYDDFDCLHDAEHRCKCGTIQMQLLKEFREADEAWRQVSGK